MLKGVDLTARPAPTIRFIDENRWPTFLAEQNEWFQRWYAAQKFECNEGNICLIPSHEGELEGVLVVVGEKPSPWAFAHLPEKLPQVEYRLAEPIDPAWEHALVFGWALGTYRFDRYKQEAQAGFSKLLTSNEVTFRDVERLMRAIGLVRDLINTPANDMGPNELAAAALEVAKAHGAHSRVVVGDELIAEGYPAIHAVGHAAAQPPQLIDIRWGEANKNKVVLVGKGVCFDSGGLNIKPDKAMRLMKKDMAGAAHVLGLAQLIMQTHLPISLRVLIPAVENSVGPLAMRPGDVIKTRKGLNVEIGHTDAEGRLILCDALEEASRDNPDVIIDFATLTGAARVALGTELPALFCNDDVLAGELLKTAEEVADPLWRMPLWPGYRKLIESKVADLNNDSSSSYGGAITAALFLEQFIKPQTPWVHLDLMAWNEKSQPGRPEGGEAMGLRACFQYLRQRFR